MGGIRGVLHYLQRTAIQGTPDVITTASGRWTRGARELDPGAHPFRKPFGSLAIGDTFHSGEREVTVDDIERFAALSGDRFYAHMDEAQANRNPLFGGRVAHGYFLVAAAAGLFVAIPAVTAYNHFVSRVKDCATEMDGAGSELLTWAQRGPSLEPPARRTGGFDALIVRR